MNLKRVLALSIISAIFSSSAFAVTEQRIAVIDINKVVLASPQVKALSKSQSLKAEEIKKFVKSAQENISKQNPLKTVFKEQCYSDDEYSDDEE